MQVQGSWGAAVYVPVCLGLAPFQAPGGSELAGVLLGIKSGPRAGKMMAGVYCSSGCLEVTGRKRARFVKNEQRPEA